MIKALQNFFFSLSFRDHLILIVLLLSLPTVALISYSGYEQRRDSLNEGVTETKMLVQGILTEQYNMTGDAVQLASTLAQLPVVKGHRVAETNAILAQILNLNHDEYVNIVIVDRTGRLWASGPPLPRVPSPAPSRGSAPSTTRSGASVSPPGRTTSAGSRGSRGSGSATRSWTPAARSPASSWPASTSNT